MNNKILISDDEKVGKEDVILLKLQNKNGNFNEVGKALVQFQIERHI